MSYDELQAQAEASWEAHLKSLIDEATSEALGEFETDRLQSYYSANQLIAQPALDRLREADQLCAPSPSASLVLATTAVEVGLKSAILRPLIYGLVHQDAVAEVIADLALAHSGWGRFRKPMFQVLKQTAKIDLATHHRTGSESTLWSEIEAIQDARNAVVHRASSASPAQADQARAVGKEVLFDIFPRVITELGFHLHGDVQLCREWRCSPQFGASRARDGWG